jgi:hypothetical protein
MYRYHKNSKFPPVGRLVNKRIRKTPNFYIFLGKKKKKSVTWFNSMPKISKNNGLR